MEVQNTFKRHLFLKIIFCFLFSPFPVHAQTSLLDRPVLKEDHIQKFRNDSIERDRVSAKKNFLKAAGGVALVEVIP